MGATARADSIPALAPHVALRIVAGGGVLLDTRSGQIYSCNDTAGDFLSRVDGTRSIAQISDEMARDYEADGAAICADMTELVATLVDEGTLHLP